MARAAVFVLLCALGFAAVAAEFELPPLPYDYGDLEPHIDKETMKVHHDMHEKMYVDKLNKALEEGPESVAQLNLTDMIMSVGSRAIPKNLTRAVRNYGGGFWNHEFFWKVMKKPEKDAPVPIEQMSKELRKAVLDIWTDFEAMRDEFNETAMDVFGSGWAWLCMNEDGDLTTRHTKNQDNTLMVYLKKNDPCWPVLGLDVWEHSYFLKWRAERKFYIGSWWNVVNWQQVSENYNKGMEVLAANKALGIKGFAKREMSPAFSRRRM